MNLIPEHPGQSPSYWCTWGMQTHSQAEPGEASGDVPARNLNEGLLFKQPGWLTTSFDSVRGDLFVLLDAGWDLPPEADSDKERWRLGSFEPDTEKFPSLKGAPEERLGQLNERVKSAGWRGVGLWVSPQLPGEGRAGYTPGAVEVEHHWKERARWSRAAGIEYWKVGVGRHSSEPAYRRLISRLARQEHPDLLVEHGISGEPFNDVPTPWDPRPSAGLGRFRSPDGLYDRALEILAYSDVMGTQDVSPQLSVATTLDRLAQLLSGGRVEPGVLGMLNSGDEVYLGAALGCALGVMRHPLWQLRPGMDDDPYQVRYHTAEVIRAVRWQRLAPAFAQGEDKTNLSRQVLYDRWSFQAGDCWAGWVNGEEIAQGAPASMARGLPLPEVRADGRPPFVVAMRHPNGAVAIAALPRILAEREIATPLADITLELKPWSGPLGVFGRYRSLTLRLGELLGKRRLWVQDLASESAADITGLVTLNENRVILSGELIADLGSSAQPSGDLSEPGLVLAMR